MALMTFAKALNEAHRIAMRADPRVFAIGEDIGAYGGVYKITEGLLEEFGRTRVLDTPISEVAIAGSGVGAALVGARPIVEIGFVDFVGTCYDQIVNQAAKFHYMSGGQASVPMVLRMACGALGLGYGVHHSQSLEAWFAHTPGLKVVMPSEPFNAKGLLLSAIADPDPVVFLEHKALYQVKGDVPDGAYQTPLGQARICREGADVTVVAWSQAVAWALKAAGELEAENIGCEVIDLQTLVPLDEVSLVRSVKKTGRLVVCHEACMTGGFGAEVVARLTSAAFDWLDAAPVRVAGPDIPVPASVPLERAYLDTPARLLAEIRRMFAHRA